MVTCPVAGITLGGAPRPPERFTFTVATSNCGGGAEFAAWRLAAGAWDERTVACSGDRMTVKVNAAARPAAATIVRLIPLGASVAGRSCRFISRVLHLT